MEVYRRIVVGGGEGDDVGGIADSVAETSDLSALLCHVLWLLLLSSSNPEFQPKCGVYPPPEESRTGRGVDVALELCTSSIRSISKSSQALSFAKLGCCFTIPGLFPTLAVSDS
jgi:hypothetical protein